MPASSRAALPSWEEWSALSLDAVLARLEDPDEEVRVAALKALRKLEPATLALHADAVVAKLEDDDSNVRRMALYTLAELEPATLAQHANAVNAVLARLEDEDLHVRAAALMTLGQLEPATLAQHAGAVVARLEDDDDYVRQKALMTLGKLEPARLVQYAGVVVARLEDPHGEVRRMACHTLEMLPRYVRYATRGVDCEELFGRALDHGACEHLRSQLLGRITWYRCRLRLRCWRGLALYWYALPYRPSGPGHARDLQAWDLMSKRSSRV